MTSTKIVPFLWFENQAEEAMSTYVSLFDNSRVIEVSRAGEDGPAMVCTFEIEGQRVIAMNGGPDFRLSEAFSFFVSCEDQEEVDHYWSALLAGGGQPSQCGWLTDRFGVTWQIIPTALPELMGDPDRERAGRVMEAMLKMQKIDVAELQRAYEGA
ncbi:MAG: VOC family protein [Hyphomicrobiales bacterium]